MLALCRRSHADGSTMILGQLEVPPNVMICVNFGFDWLRGFWCVAGRSWPIAIDFRSRPYNSASTTVQHVMCEANRVWHSEDRDNVEPLEIGRRVGIGNGHIVYLNTRLFLSSRRVFQATTYIKSISKNLFWGAVSSPLLPWKKLFSILSHTQVIF